MAHLKDELQRGWIIALVSALAIGCGAGALPIYSLSLFVGPIQSDLGWSRSSISATAAFLPAGFIFSAPVFGRLVDRFSVRAVATPSILLIALTLASLAFVRDSVGWLYLGYGLVGLFGMGTTAVAYSRIVTLWFPRNRGFGIGIMMLGTGTVAFIAPLAVEAVISRVGWRSAWVAIALWTVSVTPLVWFFLREPAKEAAASIAGETSVPAPKRGDQPGLDLREALKTWQFWCLAASGFAFMSPIGALLANIVPLLTDRGLSRTQAVEITSFLGLGAISGRLAVGVLLDRVYPPALAALTLCASVAGCLIICYWPGAAMVGTFLFGLSVGAEGNFMSFFTSRYFGIRAFSEILGWFYTPMSCGMVSGPLLAGILYGRFADYHILLLVCAALLLLAAILQGSLGPAPAFATLPKPKPDEAPQPRLHPDRTVTEKV